MDTKQLWEPSMRRPSWRKIVVVSPHFDDAALGAAHLLTRYPGSTVVTVLGGRRPPTRLK